MVPPEIQALGWNWGAFLLNWIWAIAHAVWIGLIGILPCASLIMAIVLGIKGNEWAWQNRRFASVQEYMEVQKAWRKWGVIVLLISVAINIVVWILWGCAMVAANMSGGLNQGSFN